MATTPLEQLKKILYKPLDLAQVQADAKKQTVAPVAVNPLPFSYDTQESMQGQQVMPLSLEAMNKSLSYPRLASPEEVAMTRKAKMEGLDRIKEDSDNSSDVLIYRALVESMLDQRDIHHEYAVMAGDYAMKEKDVRKKLQQEALQLKDEIDKATWRQKLSEWISWVLNIITFGAIGAGAVDVARNGVAAVGNIHAYVQGVLALIKAFNFAFKAATDQAKEEHDKKLFVKREERRLSDTKITSALSKGKDAYTSEGHLVRSLKNAIKNRRETTAVQ